MVSKFHVVGKEKKNQLPLEKLEDCVKEWEKKLKENVIFLITFFETNKKKFPWIRKNCEKKNCYEKLKDKKKKLKKDSYKFKNNSFKHNWNLWKGTNCLYILLICLCFYIHTKYLRKKTKTFEVK